MAGSSFLRVERVKIQFLLLCLSPKKYKNKDGERDQTAEIELLFFPSCSSLITAVQLWNSRNPPGTKYILPRFYLLFVCTIVSFLFSFETYCMAKHIKSSGWWLWNAAALCGQIGEDWRCMRLPTRPDGDPSSANDYHSKQPTGTFCLNMLASVGPTSAHIHTCRIECHILSQVISGNNFTLSSIIGKNKSSGK